MTDAAKHTRRAFLQAAATTVALGGCGVHMNAPDKTPLHATPAACAKRYSGQSTVSLVSCESYEEDIFKLLKANLVDLGLPSLKGKTVVLKPNMVEFRPERPLTTAAALLTAAAELVDYLGARKVIVGEGPGHFRDTDYLLDATGIGAACAKLGVPFVDLNLDELEKVENCDGLTRMKHFYLPKTICTADAVISLPKLKTHPWVGMTASMKNMFGTVPGRKYGWPKNILHWLDISSAIIDLVHLVRPSFAIVDAVISMEGDGPINGIAKKSNFIAIGADLAAVDATCARAMAINPSDLPYLRLAGEAVGNIDIADIQLLGTPLEKLRRCFALPVTFSSLSHSSQTQSI